MDIMIDVESFDWLKKINKHYQPIFGFEEEFVDMGKIESKRVEGFYKIFNNMLEITGSPERKRILDIGSNLGWFCFKFNELGAEAIGVEIDCKRVNACEQIIVANKNVGLGLWFYCADAKEWIKEYKDIKHDYVIWNNTIHHMFVQNEEETWSLFNHLINTTKGIIIMMRSSLKGWKLKYPRDIPRSIIEQSDATHVKAYERVHGRTIYHFWREDGTMTSSDTDTKSTTPTKL